MISELMLFDLLLCVAGWMIFRLIKQVPTRWVQVSIKVVTSVCFTISICLLSLLTLILAACSKTLITSRAPDQSATVRVKQICFFPDCLVNVTVQTGWWTERRIVERRDCIVNFAHVAWSPDSRVAAIFVDNGFCSSIRDAFDMKRQSIIPFEPFADYVRRSIIKEYGLNVNDLTPYRGDPLEWGHYPGDGNARPGIEAFRKKYGPERW
jgi:hypothetical protein